MSHVEISPNGKLAAWGDSSGATQKVVIFDLENNRNVRALAIESGLKLRGMKDVDATAAQTEAFAS